MTDNEIKMLLAYTAETWPQNYELPTRRDQLEIRVAVWRDQLGDLDAPLVRAAIADCADEPFPPAPGQLRAHAVRLSGTVVTPDADRAVAEIMDAIRFVGWAQVPSWTHPAISDTVAAFGGWLAVCESEHPESLRSHLLKLYATAAHRHAHDENAGPLVASLNRAAGPVSISPPTGPGRALPSEPVTDRDDEDGKAQVQATRRALGHASLVKAIGGD